MMTVRHRCDDAENIKQKTNVTTLKYGMKHHVSAVATSIQKCMLEQCS